MFCAMSQKDKQSSHGSRTISGLHHSRVTRKLALCDLELEHLNYTVRSKHSELFCKLYCPSLDACIGPRQFLM